MSTKITYLRFTVKRLSLGFYIYTYIHEPRPKMVLLEPRPLEDESLHSQLQPSPRMATAAKDRRDTALRTQRVWKPCPEPLPMSKNVRYSAPRMAKYRTTSKPTQVNFRTHSIKFSTTEGARGLVKVVSNVEHVLPAAEIQEQQEGQGG